MKKILIVLAIIIIVTSCAYLYPQLKPRCNEVCNHAAELKCSGIFTPAEESEIDTEYCTLKCEDQYGISRGMELKRCLVDAGTCDGVAGCRERWKAE